MNKAKIIFNYILGFITSVLVVILSLLLILKVTVCNKYYVQNKVKNDNYSEIIYNKIINNMKDYMVSSGLPENILDDIFSKEDINKEINNLIDNVYSGSKNEIDSTKVKEKLENNIDKYITDHDVKVTSKSYIDSFVNDMVNIYNKEVNHYGLLGMVASPLHKVMKIVNIGLIVSSILFIGCFIFDKYKGSTILSGGLIILFIRYVINYKIDFKNILIISEEFSEIVVSIYDELMGFLLLYSIILIGVGLVVILGDSFRKNTLKK